MLCILLANLRKQVKIPYNLHKDIEKLNGIYFEYDADAQPLGEGGMGRVYKGYRVIERTGERMPVAIKAIYDNIPERVVERARREANIQLDNENLIRMYGFVETKFYYDGETTPRVHYHVIMELLVGVTLENIINGVVTDNNGMQIPFAAEICNQYIRNREVAVIRIMKAVLSGLMALHDNGYIHRDIDPSNIMVTIDGKIKLIDFGICKQIVSLESLDKGLTASGVFMGKVNYAAPELVLGDVKSQDYTTDIYAMGVLLYQLYTGHLPFTGTDQDILAANLRKPLPLKDVDRSDFKKIIRKATEKVQSKRYSSAAEFRVDLEHINLNDDYKRNDKLLKIRGLVALLIVMVGIVIFNFIPSDDEQEVVPVVTKPSSNELFERATYLLAQTDSTHLLLRGKEILRALVEDSLYEPAKEKYFLLLLNSNTPEEVKKGFYGIENMALSQDAGNDVYFELGITLSKGNRSFNLPTIRQSLIGIEPDLNRANECLYKSMTLDTTDYKSVYWAFNNLMELKLEGKLPVSDDEAITSLYKLFESRINNYNDTIAEFYMSAIAGDVKTLKVWGLIK